MDADYGLALKRILRRKHAQESSGKLRFRRLARGALEWIGLRHRQGGATEMAAFSEVSTSLPIRIGCRVPMVCTRGSLR